MKARFSNLIALGGFLCLSLNAYAGDVNGKAIQCFSSEREDITLYSDAKETWFWRFHDSKAILDSIMRGSIDLEINSIEGEQYFSSPSNIRWWNVWNLHRKSLELRNEVEGFTTKCEVFQNHADYFEALEQIQIKMQKELDAVMKGNKI